MNYPVQRMAPLGSDGIASTAIGQSQERAVGQTTASEVERAHAQVWLTPDDVNGPKAVRIDG